MFNGPNWVLIGPKFQLKPEILFLAMTGYLKVLQKKVHELCHFNDDLAIIELYSTHKISGFLLVINISRIPVLQSPEFAFIRVCANDLRPLIQIL